MIKGKLGKITFKNVSDITVLDFSSWTYSGDTRDVIESEETYDGEYIENFGGGIKGGVIELSGNFKDADPGKTLIQDAFDANTELLTNDVKLFIDATKFLTPSGGTTPVSSAYVTKSPVAIEHSASGVVTITCTLQVNGVMLVS